MAESGLRPAESLLNNKSRRHVLKLMSLPKGDQAKTLPGGDTAMGNGWSTSASTPDGRERYTGGRANGTLRQHLDRRRGTGGKEGGLPTRLVFWTGGSRDETGRWGTR